MLDPAAIFPLFHNVQHISHHRLHRFRLAIPNRNRLNQELLPLIHPVLLRKMQWGILTGQHPNRHEQTTIFIMIKENKDIDGYTIRKRRSIVSLHPIVQRYTILNSWNFVDILTYCEDCINNICHYKYFSQNLIVLLES